MSHDDKYYSVMVFQRYIRRRRLARKDKDISDNDRYFKNNHGVLPAANLKERQIITNSFSSFIRTNLIVDSRIFLSATLASKNRKKILNESKNRNMSLNDKKGNVLIQAYIHSKEIKRYRNVNKNPLNVGGHIKVAKSPFDYGDTIGPENVHIQFGPNNNIGPINMDDSESMISHPADQEYQEFHFESGVGSAILEDSFDKNISDYDRSHNQMHNPKKIEKGNFSQFFDEESSIFPSEYSRGSESATPKRDKNMKGKFNHPGKYKKNLNQDESNTNMSIFFGKIP